MTPTQILENESKNKKISLTLLSLIAFIVVVLNGWMNYISGTTFYMYLEFLLGTLIALNFFIYLFHRRIDVLGYNLLIFCGLLILFIFATGGLEKSGYLWLGIFPLLSFYIFDQRISLLWVSLFCLSILMIVSAFGFHWLAMPYTWAALRQGIIGFGSFLFLTYLYELKKNKQEKIIMSQLYTDDLTGLGNRRKLVQDIRLAQTPQVVLINIDDFNEINDFYGHKVGDALLVNLSERLMRHFHDLPCRLYRLHADEFAVLAMTIFEQELLKGLVFQFNNHITTNPFQLAEQEISITITSSISFEFNNTLENADIALKLAKIKRKHFLVYDDSMKIFERYRNNLKWASIIRDAVVHDLLVPYYQPIFNNQTQLIEKYECVVRLVDKDRVITPYSFLNIAKKTKLYPKITQKMIHKSCEFFSGKPYEFSINLAVEDILNDETVEYILSEIQRTRTMGQVVFEILESEGIEQFDDVIDFIRRVKEWGCKIAIDDFGTGYSNYEYVLKLNVDYIKIDASLIKDIDTNPISEIVVGNIVNFSRQLNILTIGEFVHSESVFRKIQELKVDYTQGYFIGEPRQYLVEANPFGAIAHE